MKKASMTGNKIREFPVLFRNKNECCGCTACYSICPASAIIMEPDEEGFLYPTVIESKCLRCYKCLLVCDFKDSQASRISESGDEK